MEIKLPMLLDGAMGTMLQKAGMKPGTIPETLNITDPEMVAAIQKKTEYTTAELIEAGVRIAKDCAAETGALAGLDVGPLGVMLQPLGTLPFEEAVKLYKEIMTAGAKAGADLIAIETMSDLAETRAALIAAKEATDLPVFVTMSFEQNGRTFTGCGIQAMARTLEGLGADAIGINCSLGPDLLAPLLAELCTCTTLPVIAKPNAGLPDPATGEYDMRPEDFARALAPCAEYGVTLFGGCCGTSPEYIKLLSESLKGKEPAPRSFDAVSFVCSAVALQAMAKTIAEASPRGCSILYIT